MVACNSHFLVYITAVRDWSAEVEQSVKNRVRLIFCLSTRPCHRVNVPPHIHTIDPHENPCAVKNKPNTHKSTKRCHQILNLPKSLSTLGASPSTPASPAAGCQLSSPRGEELWDAAEYTLCISLSFHISVNQQAEEYPNHHQICGVVPVDRFCLR